MELSELEQQAGMPIEGMAIEWLRFSSNVAYAHAFMKQSVHRLIMLVYAPFMREL